MIDREEFGEVIDCIGYPVFIKNQQFEYVFANGEAYKMYGISMEKVLGKTDYELFPKEQADLFRKQDNYVFETGEKSTNEYKVIDAEGATRIVIGRKTLYVNKIGEKHIVGVIQDITERKKSEEALITSQLRLSEAMDLAHVVYWEVNEVKKGLTLNDQFYAFCGTTCEIEGGYQITGEEYVKRFVHSDDQPLFYQYVKQNILQSDSNKSVDFEHRIVRRDGQVLYVRTQTRSLKDDSGRIIKVYGITQDITERKKMEDTVRESEEIFRLLFEKSVDPTVIKYEGKYVDCNEAAVSHLQCSSRDQILGLGTLDFSPERQPDGRLSSEKLNEIDERTLKEGSNHFEWMRRTMTGKELWNDVSHTVIPIKGDKFFYSVWRNISERKRVEAEIKASEEKLRTVFDQTFQLMGLLSPQGSILYANNSALDFITSEEPDIIGKPFWDTPWWSHSEKERNKLKKAISMAKNGEAVRFETTHDHKDGTLHYIDFSLRPVKDEKGIIVYLNAEGHDVTAIKEKEKALKQAEAKYRAIFENASVGIYQTSMQGHIIIANQALASISGYDSPEEMINSVVNTGKEAYVNPEDRIKIVQLCQQKGFVEDFETQFYKKDKSIYRVSVSARPVKDNKGNIVYLEGTVEDITARKKAEEDFKATHQRLNDIIEFLPDAVFVINEKKEVVFWNLACEELTGVKKEEIIGKGDYAYAMPFYGKKRSMLIDYATVDFDEANQKYEGLRRKDNMLYAEAFTPKLNNEKGAFLSGKASPLFGKDGEMVGAIEVLRDLTEIKRLETQLRQAQKMEAIGTLAGGIAHDFNNILTALMGYASLLKMNITNESLNRYADQIMLASQKAADLIKNLLAFSRQQVISLKAVSLNDIVKETGKLLKRLVTENIAIRTLFDDKDIIIMADKSQIDQILFNLATNARDAMPNGGIFTIETKTAELDDEFLHFHGHGKPGQYALISVTDTGVGMNEATKERIFDPFFTTKEVGKGTGMGLATVYGVVKQHNGFIIVYSEPLIGTTFHIYLPAIEQITKKEKDALTEVKGGNEVILVAEDDMTVRSYIKEILTKYGYIIIEASNGSDAVEQFVKTDKIDLLIFDSVMPKKNGWEAYNEIININPNIKVIFTSGYTKDVFPEQDIDDKNIIFIQKPVLSRTILQKTREMLDR